MKTALLVFTRAPIPGQTKTRLIPCLGAQGAAEFHQTVLRLMLVEAKASDFATVEIWSTTENIHPFLKQCASDYSCVLNIQQGHDLGERMHNATKARLEDNEFVVIIGSDCPAITTDILNQAYQSLANGKDAVLGFAKDGGYYLIGLKTPQLEIFQNITWGEADVAQITRQKFARLKLDFLGLVELNDIDTPEDYQRYISDI